MGNVALHDSSIRAWAYRVCLSGSRRISLLSVFCPRTIVYHLKPQLPTPVPQIRATDAQSVCTVDTNGCARDARIASIRRMYLELLIPIEFYGCKKSGNVSNGSLARVLLLLPEGWNVPELCSVQFACSESQARSDVDCVAFALVSRVTGASSVQHTCDEWLLLAFSCRCVFCHREKVESLLGAKELAPF